MLAAAPLRERVGWRARRPTLQICFFAKHHPGRSLEHRFFDSSAKDTPFTRLTLFFVPFLFFSLSRTDISPEAEAVSVAPSRREEVELG